MSNHWFKLLKTTVLLTAIFLISLTHSYGLAQKARPVMIEAICRQYITGSYVAIRANGEREFAAVSKCRGLKRRQETAELLITPSTKGILKGIPGVRRSGRCKSHVRTSKITLQRLTSLKGERYRALRATQEGFNVISDAR
ncbi:hypothetical protein OH492_08860 [Vibrio chagasii]|nr:hypothetical protein [Vibrio chagasii]